MTGIVWAVVLIGVSVCLVLRMLAANIMIIANNFAIISLIEVIGANDSGAVSILEVAITLGKVIIAP